MNIEKNLLRKQLLDWNKNPVEEFAAELIDGSDLFKREIMIIGPTDTVYDGEFSKAHLTFPSYSSSSPFLTIKLSEVKCPKIY